MSVPGEIWPSVSEACALFTPSRGCSNYSQPTIFVLVAQVEVEVVGPMLAMLANTKLAVAHGEQSATDSHEFVTAIMDDEGQLDELMSDLAAKRITRREWEVFRGTVADRIADNKAKLVAMEVETDLPGEVWQGIDADGWESPTFDQKRELVGVMVNRITIDKGEPGRKWNPGRVHIDWRIQ